MSHYLQRFLTFLLSLKAFEEAIIGLAGQFRNLVHKLYLFYLKA